MPSRFALDLRGANPTQVDEISMTQIDMVPVPEPDPNSGTVMTYPEGTEGPVVRSTGDTNFRCGRCKQALLQRVGRQQYAHVIFKCPACATYNRIPRERRR